MSSFRSIPLYLHGHASNTKKWRCSIHRVAYVLGLLLVAWACALPATAQLAPPGSSPPRAESAGEAVPEPTLEERQAELTAKIAALDDQISAADARATEEQAAALGLSLSTLQDFALSLRQQRSVYEDHLGVVEQMQELQRQQEDLKRETVEYQGPTEPPPYTPWFVDTYRDAVSAKQTQLELDKNAVGIAKGRLARTKSDLGSAEAALARSRDEAAASSDPATLPVLEWEVQSARANVKLLQATVPLNELQIKAAEHKVALRESQLELLERKLEDVQAGERYREEDLETRKQEIAKTREDLQSKLKEGIKQKDTDQRKLSDARNALAEAPSDELSPRQAEVEFLKVQAAASSDRVKVLRDRLDFLLYEEEIWSTRYKLHLDRESITLLDERKRADDYAAALDAMLQARLADLEGVRAALREWDRKLTSAQGETSETALARRMIKVLNEHLDTFRTGLTALTAQQQVNNHLLEDLRAAQERLSVGERWDQFGEQIRRVWDYQFPVDVGGESLTLSQVILAALILVIGFICIRFIRRYVRKVVLAHTRMDANASANLERLIHYFLLILVVLFAMNTVGIPLTAFTLFGGALAIGIGFGAQNLINNFISGLILMMERPIRIGDLVEVDDRTGYIEEIGARCSRLRMFSGVDVLIPNSTFLEKNVINWTLSDAKVRFSVSVGVAYGSPTREVSKLIMKAVTEHGRVLDDPEPVVIFSEFGDNALIFDVYFWLIMGPATDARVVRSDIRHRIDKLFKEAGIVIAFPQRDLHLDTAAPLEVRLVSPGSEPEEEHDTSGE